MVSNPDDPGTAINMGKEKPQRVIARKLSLQNTYYMGHLTTIEQQTSRQRSVEWVTLRGVIWYKKLWVVIDFALNFRWFSVGDETSQQPRAGATDARLRLQISAGACNLHWLPKDRRSKTNVWRDCVTASDERLAALFRLTILREPIKAQTFQQPRISRYRQPSNQLSCSHATSSRILKYKKSSL